MQLPVRLALAVHGQREVGKRVLVVGVAATLGDEHVGFERGDGTRDDCVEGPQPPVVRGRRWQREVQRTALAQTLANLGRHAGTRVEGAWVLMHRDRQYPGIVVEGHLHAVAVVDVDVNVGDPLRPRVEQCPDRQHHIVEHAEAGRRITHRVMQPTGDVHRVLGPPVPDLQRCHSRTARDQSGRVVHPGEHGIVIAAEPVPEISRLDARRSHGLQIVSRVDGQQLRFIGNPRFDHGELVEHSEAAGQGYRQVEPDRGHRVFTEVVVEIARAPHQRRPAALPARWFGAHNPQR